VRLGSPNVIDMQLGNALLLQVNANLLHR